MMPEKDMQRERGRRKNELDQYSKFLEYNSIKPLMSKELSLGIIQREDLPSFLRTVVCARTLMKHGCLSLGRSVMTDLLAELKLTASIDGTLLDNIFHDKIQYDQTQHVYEHLEPEPRRGLFHRKKRQE